MSKDIEMMRFCGRVGSMGEEYLGAIVSSKYYNYLWEKYVEESKPENQQEWIFLQMKADFHFVGQPPRWVEKLAKPRWPFLDGVPMTFIHQFSVPSNSVSNEFVSPEKELYVFGGRNLTQSGGWEMKYEIIQQDPNLP